MIADAGAHACNAPKFIRPAAWQILKLINWESKLYASEMHVVNEPVMSTSKYVGGTIYTNHGTGGLVIIILPVA
jgi:hypothetical protein